MSTTTNGRDVKVAVRLDPDPLYVAPDEVTTNDFHFGLALTLVFVVVVLWIVTRGV